MSAWGTRVRTPLMIVSSTCSTDVSRLSEFGVNTKVGAGPDQWGKIIRLIDLNYVIDKLRYIFCFMKFTVTQLKFIEH